MRHTPGLTRRRWQLSTPVSKHYSGMTRTATSCADPEADRAPDPSQQTNEGHSLTVCEAFTCDGVLYSESRPWGHEVVGLPRPVSVASPACGQAEGLETEGRWKVLAHEDMP